jgi:predicted GIY-YIG superfamily endonuclease
MEFVAIGQVKESHEEINQAFQHEDNIKEMRPKEKEKTVLSLKTIG